MRLDLVAFPTLPPLLLFLTEVLLLLVLLLLTIMLFPALVISLALPEETEDGGYGAGREIL